MVAGQDWIREEFGSAELGDERLTERLVYTAALLAAQPTASIPQACGSWAATKGAYRLFDNEKTTPMALIEAHREATLERLKGQAVVLAVQDTTELSLTHHPATQGLGPIGAPPAQGLLVHSTLAVSRAGVPLGLLAQQVWARDPEDIGKRARRKKTPTVDKESQKWLDGLAESQTEVPVGVRLVMVGDREADIYDLFHAAHGEADLLVRAAYDRGVDSEEGHLWASLAATPIAGHYTITVPRADDQPSRAATLEVHFAEVRIRPPSNRPGKGALPDIPLAAVWAIERHPLADTEPIEWMLLTSVAVRALAEAIERIVWYTYRWVVERYHFTLKSGCRVEQRQLETAERMANCFAVYAVIAWRLLWLTYAARRTPEVSSTVALTTAEWQALRCFTQGTGKGSKTPPSLREAVRAIAQLGGFLGRRSDGEPGVMVLWRGFQRLQDLAKLWRLLNSKNVGNA